MPTRFTVWTLSIILGLPLAYLRAAEQQGKFFVQTPVVAPSQTNEPQPHQEPTRSTAASDLDLAGGPPPYWIWGGDGERFVFRTTFAGGSKAARLVASCDNVMTVRLNGKRVASSDQWQTPVKVDVQQHIQPGENVLSVEASNQGGPAGLALKLALELADGTVRYIVTDDSWEANEGSDAGRVARVQTLGKMGIQPWGDVFSQPVAALTASAPRDVFITPPGFQVELLYAVPKDTQGSWVSICFDPQGRLIASDQGAQGLFRITPAPVGGQGVTKVEPLDLKITSAQGMLHAFDSLYLSVNGGPGSGFYRARDTDQDDQYDQLEKLRDFRGGGEHGPHAIRLGPDGKSLYVVCGNHTDPVEDLAASRIPTNWAEDLLLPRQWDARGHARGRLAPGGWIVKTDADGKTWEMFSIGYRNTYDMAFNADGELFAYDADMEWDLGTPWYRPTRVVHATSGSEFGWRSGTGKWPAYYVDSLPQLLDIGPGSPVGVTFGYGTKFPARFQKALYLLDWTFGTIYAVHTSPQGASYSALKEEFVSRTPLPLTDAAVGPDGALYFTIGGRNTQSELYRVTYVGDESTAAVAYEHHAMAELRSIRHRLEAFHGRQAPDAVDQLWPFLGHADRHIRYAARVALEAQDHETWQQRVLDEANPQSLITAMVAMARQGDPAWQQKALQALEKIDFAQLTTIQQLELLRVYQLIFIRMGEPDPQTAARLAKRLDPFYPANEDGLNRELCNLLVYLNSPTVIDKTLDLMQREYVQTPADLAELLARNAGYGGTIAKMLSNQPEIEKIHYAFALRNMKYGWTLEQRQAYFDWLNGALNSSGGASYEGFINNIRAEAMEKLSPAEKKALESQLVNTPIKSTDLPKPEGPGKEWDTSAVVQVASGALQSRNYEHGKRMFAASRCIICHRFNGEGGATGPDLSNVAGRFNIRDLSESLVEPSKTVSDQYRASVILTADNRVITGRVVGETDDKLTVQTNPEDATQIVVITKDDIEVLKPSETSLMPTGLLNTLNPEEVLDLLAFLMSRGNPNDLMFAQ